MKDSIQGDDFDALVAAAGYLRGGHSLGLCCKYYINFSKELYKLNKEKLTRCLSSKNSSSAIFPLSV
jgi:hypothetical protein